jgi:hypothetical protein
MVSLEPSNRNSFKNEPIGLLANYLPVGQLYSYRQAVVESDPFLYRIGNPVVVGTGNHLGSKPLLDAPKQTR